MGASVLDLIVAVGLADFGQLPAPVEPREPPEILERQIGSAVHACLLSVGGKALGALKWEKPLARPDRDIDSEDCLESVAQLPHGALVALAGGGLGQAQFPGGLSLREALDGHADHEQRVRADGLVQVLTQVRVIGHGQPAIRVGRHVVGFDVACNAIARSKIVSCSLPAKCSGSLPGT